MVYVSSTIIRLREKILLRKFKNFWRERASQPTGWLTGCHGYYCPWQGWLAPEVLVPPPGATNLLHVVKFSLLGSYQVAFKSALNIIS